MENQLQKISSSSFDEIARMSKLFFDSKMFADLTSAAQAGVKILAGAELGIAPFNSISGIHIIKGKPVIGAGIMASMVDKHPDYDYEVLQQTDKVCEIKFLKNGKVRGISKFTEDDAKKAGTQNMGKFPANMLFARAMSNGVKWYAPGVFSGPVYVPEEFQDIEHEEVKEPTKGLPKETPKEEESNIFKQKLDDKKEEDLNPKEKAHTDYVEFLSECTHVFNEAEMKKHQAKDEWLLKDYHNALIHLKKLRKEREDQLNLVAHGN